MKGDVRMQTHTGVTRREILAATGAAGLAAVAAVSVAAEARESAPAANDGVNPWGVHKTANAAEIEKQYMDGKTGHVDRFKPQGLRMTTGLHLTEFGSPRPDLNGLRVKLPNADPIYLILDGYRRWIPDPDTYNNLFRNWDGVIVDIDINDIPEGPPLSHGAILARALNTAPVYLVSNGLKRWVTSPAAMDKYWFAWEKVLNVPASLLDPLPPGAPLS
jgi:hypothetical protein